MRFTGVLAERLRVNQENWLLRAPAANPGMLEMFRVRDRKPVPNLVPWAGEFVGKYLISAIQALRLESDPARQAALRATVATVVSELIAAQAEDGYLGPFPKADRLKGNWDLWGHYHCMLALLMWHEATGDPTALKTCTRAADLVCATFLDTKLRVFDAGSHEMNMAIIHSLGWLHRLTHEPKYLRMMREIEKDWERAGDYLRSGLDGREFYESPRPRWESLHDLQGLVELYRATGDARYRQAFEHHWRSILRWDRHNDGAFSSGEQATGNPYAPTAIETCCTVAWMAISIDMLELTGDPRVADELELSTYNGAAGAQHPSGRWWTYNTPMDGAREASAHSIVFQSRAGTPELNCCSVNGPRSLGMLSEWAVMSTTDALIINGYEPGEFDATLPNGSRVAWRCDGEYPRQGKVRLTLATTPAAGARLWLRIPQWSARTAVQVNGQPVADVRAGTYLELSGRARGDVIALEFDTSLRAVPGAHEATGKVSVYRGPLLLAYDQRLNSFDEDAIPALDLARLAEAKVLEPARADSSDGTWLRVDVPAKDGRTVRVCDFASAGAMGTRYRSWLAAADCPPPPVVTKLPADGATIPAGTILFRWSGPKAAGPHTNDYRLIIREAGPMGTTVLERGGLGQVRLVLAENDAPALVPNRSYEWEVVARNAHGSTSNLLARARFRVDPKLPRVTPEAIAAFTAKPPEVLTAAPLRGDPKPRSGTLSSATGARSAPGRQGEPDGAVELDGAGGRLVYGLNEFPEENYTLAVWVRINKLPEGRIGQVCSAWATGMDDPLRVCVDHGKLFARIEAGQGYSTEGVPVGAGQWHHIAAVKDGARLTLYLDGVARAHAAAPETLHTTARDFALGGNPHFGGNEFLAAQFAGLVFYSRALGEAEIKKLE